MPTYEYNCPKCGVFEEFHSINASIDQCPKCGSEVHRLISRNHNIIFKGSGFHVTDYRSGDYQKKSDSESPKNSTSTTSSSTTEPKPSKDESKAS